MPEKLQILHEDKYLTVIYKPENILSVPYPGSRERNVLDTLTEIRRKRGLVHGQFKPAAVHRLDRETSGVMMFALSPDARQRIMDSWQKMVIHRYYTALAETPSDRKLWLPEEGVIDLPLTKNAYHHSYVADPKRGGKPMKNEVQAVTHYKVLSADSKYTLFQLELETGRTNQIRAHLAAKNYPLAGDRQYRARTDPFHRLCLHAATLEFIHPYTKEQMLFQHPEPAAWGKMIRKQEEPAKQ